MKKIVQGFSFIFFLIFSVFLYFHCGQRQMQRPATGCGPGGCTTQRPWEGGPGGTRPDGTRPGGTGLNPGDFHDSGGGTLPSWCSVHPEECPDGSNNKDGEGGSSEEPEALRQRYRTIENVYGYRGGRLNITGDIRDYRRGYSSNYPITRGRVFVKLSPDGSNKYYSGEVVIVYELKHDNSNIEPKWYRWMSGNGDRAQYNVWANFEDSSKGFHGFFSDRRYGSVILTMNSPQVPDYGDNRANRLESSGEIWFRMFKAFESKGQARRCYEDADHIDGQRFSGFPSNRCWFAGGSDSTPNPFDCRAWKRGFNDVDHLRTLNPAGGSSQRDGDCYKKLGDFQYLDVKKAFNIEAANELRWSRE